MIRITFQFIIFLFSFFFWLPARRISTSNWIRAVRTWWWTHRSKTGNIRWSVFPTAWLISVNWILQTLSNSFVHHARVADVERIHYCSAAGRQHKETTVPESSCIIILYTDSYSGPKFKGEFNTGYNLEIQADSKTYTATTTIPGLNKYIDSLWWVPAPLECRLTAGECESAGSGSAGTGKLYPLLHQVNDEPVLSRV